MPLTARCRSKMGLGAWSWLLLVGTIPLEPNRFSRYSDRIFPSWHEFQQIRDASIHLSEAPLLEPVATYATKKADASQLASVPAAVPVGAIIAGPRGEWLSTLYYTTKRDRRYIRLVLIRSFDHGRSWNEDGIIAALQPGEKPWPWMGSEGPNEAGLVRLSDGRLFCIFRTGSYDSYMGEPGHLTMARRGLRQYQPASKG